MIAGKSLAILMSAFLCTASPHVAASAGDKPSPVIDGLRAAGASVVPLESGGGLAGYLVKPLRGAPYTLYIAPDGHAVAGLLYDPEGNLLSERQIAAAARSKPRPQLAAGPASPQSKGPASMQPDSRFGAAVSAFGFTLGRSGPIVVLFGDPSCSWSRSAVARLGQAALAGGFRLRVVPVGVLGAEAVREAASIASSPDPALAWFSRAEVAIRPQGARRIAANNALYEDWERNAVPLVLWRNLSGGTGMNVGDIADIDMWRRQLGHE